MQCQSVLYLSPSLCVPLFVLVAQMPAHSHLIVVLTAMWSCVIPAMTKQLPDMYMSPHAGPLAQHALIPHINSGFTHAACEQAQENDRKVSGKPADVREMESDVANSRHLAFHNNDACQPPVNLLMIVETNVFLVRC